MGYKEMTIEEKAKAYDEALEKARCYYEGANGNEDMITMTTTMFPVLKESEDERIRKSLIDMLKNDEKCYLKEIAWLEKQGEQKPYGLREECKDCQCNYAGECKGSCAMKRNEQKPWGKEDENLFKLSLENLTELKDRFGEEYGKVGDCIVWFESLKERVQPQPKQEWSEVDEIIVDVLYAYAEKANQNGCPNDAKRIEAAINKLKSLRPQSTWKPSKRQKEALLWCVVHLGGADKQTLGELLEELNKL